MYMLYTDGKFVSSMYRVIYHVYALYRCEICLYHVQIMYHICMSLLGLSVTHTEFCIIYMLFTASSRSACSTYRVNLTCL